MSPRVPTLIAAALMAASAAVFAAAARAQTPPASSGAFDGCPVRGRGGDPELNTQKNRSAFPPSYGPIRVADMRALPSVPQQYGTTRGPSWPPVLLASIRQNESRGVTFAGYIIHAKPEGPESPNCGSSSPRDHDVHVYVGDNAGDAAASSAIAEVTPRWRDTNATWNATALQGLATAGAHVRISGYLLYDQEHWDMIQQHQRSTLWEIHPITNVEVETNRGWIELAAYGGGTAGNQVKANTAPRILVHVRTAAQSHKALAGASSLP